MAHFLKSQYQEDFVFYRQLNQGLRTDPLPLLGSLWDDIHYSHRDSHSMRSLLLAELLPESGLKCLELLITRRYIHSTHPKVDELFLLVKNSQQRSANIQVLLGRPVAWESLDFMLAAEALRNACLVNRPEMIPPLQARLEELGMVMDVTSAALAAGTGHLDCLKLVIEGVEIGQSRPLLSSIAGLQLGTLRWLLEQGHWHPQAPEWALLSNELEIVQQVLAAPSGRVGPDQLRSLLIFSLRNFSDSRWAMFLLVDRAAPATIIALQEAVHRGYVDVVRVLIPRLPVSQVAKGLSTAIVAKQEAVSRVLRRALLEAGLPASSVASIERSALLHTNF